MKKYLSILLLLLMGWSCRPQEEITITDSSVFDYNFQMFITGKNNDTLNVNKWYQYEVYRFFVNFGEKYLIKQF